MTTITYLILGFTAVATSTISALIGMGGGIIFLSITLFFIPLKIAIPVHGIAQVFSNAYRSFLLRNYIKWKVSIPYFLGLPIGFLISISLLKSLTSDTIPLTLIILMIFYTVFRPKKLPPLKIPHKAFFLVGITVGTLSLLIGATGPFLAPFFLRDDFTKEEIVATKAICQTAGHLLKIPAFLYLDFNYAQWTPFILIMIVASFIGTNIGIKLLKNIKTKYFIILYKVALLSAGIRLIFKVLV